MLFNSRSIAWVAVATLLGPFDIISSVSGFGTSRMQLKARHNSLHSRQDAVVEKRSPELTAVLEEKPVVITHRKRSTKKCRANTPASNVEMAPNPQSAPQSRLDKIRGMYAFAGFVYSIEACPSKTTLKNDFSDMVKKHSARTVITFGACQSGGYYGQIIDAANSAGIDVILLADTLVSGSYGSGDVSSTINNIVKAVKANPDPVLAIAIGDEPLYDTDLGGAGGIASKINSVKGQLKSAGLDIPVSISDMAFGWQSAGQTSSSSSVAKAVDFFMINTFPYFGQSASWGGNDNSWQAFTKDISFFESIANGKPLLVTQTGWPSNTAEFAPNSGSIIASKSSSQAYWELLNGHCSDYFKKKNLGWMWRSYTDTITGWGLLDGSGNPKFSTSGTKTSC